jgi:hypothetical protein
MGFETAVRMKEQRNMHRPFCERFSGGDGMAIGAGQRRPRKGGGGTMWIDADGGAGVIHKPLFGRAVLEVN